MYIWMSIVNTLPCLTYWYRNSSYEHSNYTLTRENTWKKTILSKGRFWRIVNNSNSLAFSSCYQFKLYFEQTCQISQNFLFLIPFHLSPEILCVLIYQKRVLLYIQSLFPEFNVSWRVQDVKLRGLLVMLSNIIAWRLFYKNSINIISKNQSYNLFRNMSFWYMKLNWLT